MQKELVYVQNTRVFILEKNNSFFKTDYLGKKIEIKEAEELGRIFPLEINQILKDKKSARKKLEEIFQNMPFSNPLTSSLEDYLEEADINFTLAKSPREKIQYLGLTYEDPINLEFNIKRTIIPCRFYLIKDCLELERYFKYASVTSEASPSPSEASD